MAAGGGQQAKAHSAPGRGAVICPGAAQGWAASLIRKPRRGAGTYPSSLSPNIPLFILNPMLLQQRDELFLERHVPVMLVLARDVSLDRVDAGAAHAETAVSVLPTRPLRVEKRLSHE